MAGAETTVPARWYERVTDFMTQCGKCGHPISALQVHWARRYFTADVAQLRAALASENAPSPRANFQRRCMSCGPEPGRAADKEEV